MKKSWYKLSTRKPGSNSLRLCPQVFKFLKSDLNAKADITGNSESDERKGRPKTRAKENSPLSLEKTLLNHPISVFKSFWFSTISLLWICAFFLCVSAFSFSFTAFLSTLSQSCLLLLVYSTSSSSSCSNHHSIYSFSSFSWVSSSESPSSGPQDVKGELGFCF